MPKYLLRHRTQKDFAESAPAVGSYDHDVGALLAGTIQQASCDITFQHGHLASVSSLYASMRRSKL
jgi:hypothetical protein